jgi:hypothetical protein
MASIALTAAGAVSAVGGASVSSALTKLAASTATNVLAGQLFSRPSRRHIEGARLEELAVQTSTYGKVIPEVVGSMRLGGNVIWSQPIRELVTTRTTTTSGGKGGGGGRSATTTETRYSYDVTLAIAIAQGPIASVERVWADAQLLDLSQGTYRIYYGDEDQLPDPLIEAVYGTGETPAYRGTAYIVIEHFPLADFGNRIPNFSFEITRHVTQTDIDDQTVEEAVRAMMLLPGSGEYVYDTKVQEKQDGLDASGAFVPQGYRSIVNQHTYQGKANALVAIDHMMETFPSLEWVGIVVNWFGTSLNVADCEFFPAVEFKTTTRIMPDPWSVAGYNRDNAYLIGSDANGNIRYGGTPDDGSLMRMIEELRSRGLKVALYPMPLIDVEGKPWRGRLSGDPADVHDFFTRPNGYNRFIMHYAQLLSGKLDAMMIGTEMKALTAITDGEGVFPSVDQFVALAASVKQSVGSATLVSYAADWSEYHHADAGWYHLDPLWASPDIDVIGIDAYFPLTNAPQSQITKQTIEEGWRSGEGYDFYYADSERTDAQPLSPAYAWKNIEWWWNNLHTNPNGQQTPWIPQSKPIWFTEYGFPSVDGAANQPNVFVDASSSESAYPRFSNRQIDFVAQRDAIIATERAWENSPVVTKRFLWAWDARPYPAWPDLRDVWSDGANWITGHWVQGKLGTSDIGAFLKQLFVRAGLAPEAIDVSEINGKLDGFIISRRSTVRAICEQLQLAFGFDLIESEGILRAVPRGNASVATVTSTECVPASGSYAAIEINRTQETELPKRVEVQYLARSNDYNTQQQASTREVTDARDTETISLSMALSEETARNIADIRLHERWRQRTVIQCSLPLAYAYLEPSDVILLRDGNNEHRVKITQIQFGRPGMLKIQAVSEAQETFAHYVSPQDSSALRPFEPLALTAFEMLDIPLLPNDQNDQFRMYAALTGQGNLWPGGVIQRISQSDAGRFELARSNVRAVIGQAATVLAHGDTHVFDQANSVEVVLLGDAELHHAASLAVLNGANAAVLGDEIIQFTTAEQLGNQHYRLSGLLRGRLGTERATTSHVIGERFVLLDDALVASDMQHEDLGRTIRFQGVTLGSADGMSAEADLVYHARALRPYAPVHLTLTRLTNGDVQCQWVRRARLNSGWVDGIDVPLDERMERYQLAFLYQGQVVHRTEVGTPDYIYTAAQQLADTGVVAPQLQLEVRQLSERVGPGSPALQSL